MSRRERRADPPRWYGFDAYLDTKQKEPIGLGQYEQHVLGHIDSIIVVQIPDTLSPEERLGFMEGFRQVTALANSEFQFIMVPSSVKLVRLRPIEPHFAKELDRQLRLRQVEARVRSEKAAGPSDVKKPS